MSIGHQKKTYANCNKSTKLGFAVVSDAFEKGIGYLIVKDNSECAASDDEKAYEEPKRAKMPLHMYILAR